LKSAYNFRNLSCTSFLWTCTCHPCTSIRHLD